MDIELGIISEKYVIMTKFDKYLISILIESRDCMVWQLFDTLRSKSGSKTESGSKAKSGSWTMLVSRKMY